MQEDQTFEEQLQIAQQQIKSQFDPQHPEYHKGDPTPVPIGGQRVPSSMPSEFPENQAEKNVEEEKEQEVNPQREIILQQREKLAELKKNLEKINPLIESKLRFVTRLQTSKKQSNIEKANELIQQENQKILNSIEQVKVQMQQNQSNEKFQKFAQEVEELLALATTDFQSKEAAADFGFRMKKLTEAIFRDMKDLLQQAKSFK